MPTTKTKDKKSKNSPYQPHTFKAVPVGDGSLYGWREYDENGGMVQESVMTWPTEADAEKAIRALVRKVDRIEVENIKNINPEANTNVDLVRRPAATDDRFAGMNLVDSSIESRGNPSDQEKADAKEAATSKKEGQANSSDTTGNSARARTARSTRPRSPGKNR